MDTQDDDPDYVDLQLAMRAVVENQFGKACWPVGRDKIKEDKNESL